MLRANRSLRMLRRSNGRDDALDRKLVAGKHLHLLAIAHDTDAVAVSEQLLQLRRNHVECHPAVAQVLDEADDLGVGADVYAAGGFIEDENTRLRGQRASRAFC